jgi:acyl-CoA dehydrogenase
MSSDIAARIETWLQHCPAPETDPLPGMAEAGLLEPAENYATIARTKAALVERTGLPGVAGVWGGRQMVERWFIAGFGDAAQRAAWLGRTASVAISEPRVGAHPKYLTTRAEPDGDGVRITGEKAWVSNGPSADVFVVLAIASEHEGRKRYSAFLVPRDAAGVALNEMPAFHALRPSRHCGLLLENVRVPRSAMLGAEGGAYETMALPFRDIEDAVGTFSLLGAFRFIRARLVAQGAASDDAAMSVGGIAALTSVFAEAAEAVVAALDANRLAGQAATLAGLHVLAAQLVERVRAHRTQFGPADAAAVESLLNDLHVMLSVARGPRLARLARLGRLVA